MASQFENWTTADRTYPIMTLRFRTLWEQLREVFSFLGLPFRLLSNFPEYRSRQSDWTDLPPEDREQLTAIYDDLLSEMGNQPDIYVR
jgi:hypothetical protein